MKLDRAVDNFFAETEQVAFCTANVIPGIDFTDDPLLQGRNFSYLDTQLKRLGGPNFTKLPVNAPKGCPVSNYPAGWPHADRNARKGRVNYEPNGWGEGPRAHPLEGYVSYSAPVTGVKVRLRPESFADHYSQARQFYISQTLSNRGTLRPHWCSSCRNAPNPPSGPGSCRIFAILTRRLAELVADRLGLGELPAPAPAARPTRTDLAPHRRSASS